MARYEDFTLSFPNPFFEVGIMRFSVLSFEQNEPSFKEKVEEDQPIDQVSLLLWERIRDVNPLHLAIRCYQLK